MKVVNSMIQITAPKRQPFAVAPPSSPQRSTRPTHGTPPKSEGRDAKARPLAPRFPIPSCNSAPASRTGNPISDIDMKLLAQLDSCELIDGRIAVKFPISSTSFPLIKKQKIDSSNFDYIGYHNTRLNDNRSPDKKTVGYFTDDRHFRNVTREPWAYVDRLKQYLQTMTPDNSCYTDMSADDQRLAIFLSRLAGALWQAHGLTVIPTLTWGDSSTYDFSFLGIEQAATVAVSTLGTAEAKGLFMSGFKEMCSTINPELVLCYCTPYPEMSDYAEVQFIEHEARLASRIARAKRNYPGQTLFDYFQEG